MPPGDQFAQAPAVRYRARKFCQPLRPCGSPGSACRGRLPRSTGYCDVPRGTPSTSHLRENGGMPMLNLEHVALNVADPAAMAAWYVKNLGMRIVRQSAVAPYIHFLADAAGRSVIDVYSNDADPFPDYASMHPLRLHVAFATSDPDGSRAALEAAGATFVDEMTRDDGTRLVMLRDPWGLALQLCKRPEPLL